MTVVGRENEYLLLKSAIKGFLKNETSTKIYISGVPGSGKTYTLLSVLKDMKVQHTYINSGHLRLKSLIYKSIYDSLTCKKKKSQTFVKSLHDHFSKCQQPHLIVIDEIDLLFDKSQGLLYNLFDLVYLENGKLFLILVSNTFNLPYKSLKSKLCSRIGNSKIEFKPYTYQQLLKIMKTQSLQSTFDMEIVARRVGAVYGDCRKALGVLKKQKESLKNTSLKITSPLYFIFLSNLSYYQKLVLFIILEDKERKCYEIYSTLKVFCNSKDITKISFFEFSEVIKDLINYGLIKCISFKHKISLNLFEEDIRKALSQDDTFNFFSTKQNKL